MLSYIYKKNSMNFMVSLGIGKPLINLSQSLSNNAKNSHSHPSSFLPSPSTDPIGKPITSNLLIFNKSYQFSLKSLISAFSSPSCSPTSFFQTFSKLMKITNSTKYYKSLNTLQQNTAKIKLTSKNHKKSFL